MIERRCPTDTSVQLTTPNAWEAVHTLVTDSWLWIDQICIDQGNPAEKDVQIGLMNEIYSPRQILEPP
jgi:hypothetical protein